MWCKFLHCAKRFIPSRVHCYTPLAQAGSPFSLKGHASRDHHEIFPFIVVKFMKICLIDCVYSLARIKRNSSDIFAKVEWKGQHLFEQHCELAVGCIEIFGFDVRGSIGQQISSLFTTFKKCCKVCLLCTIPPYEDAAHFHPWAKKSKHLHRQVAVKKEKPGASKLNCQPKSCERCCSWPTGLLVLKIFTTFLQAEGSSGRFSSKLVLPHALPKADCAWQCS